jgi:serine/threonine-protein kinase
VIGTTIDSYIIRERIGEGGMGTVYLAEHTVLGRRAAIKILLPELSHDRSVVARFLNEARSASSIHHPAIVEIFDFGMSPERGAYIVMEYLEGETLRARRARLTRLDPHRALVIARQIASGLAAAHQLGIVHRDLKPDNVFLVADPDVFGGERIKLLDFGIAKVQRSIDDTSRTITGSMLGTPTYMSPEQCRGSTTVDARADLYALGCVLYELLCGRPPFIADGAGDLIAHHLYFEPPPPRQLDPTLPEAIERLVLSLLRKDPAHRPQGAAEVIDAIDRVDIAPPARPRTPSQITGPVASRASPTTLSGASGVTQRPHRRGRARWIAPAAGLVAAGLATAIYLASGHRNSGDERGAVPAPSPGTTHVLAPSSPPPPSPPAPSAPPAPVQPPVTPESSTVKLTIVSDPDGATVEIGGKSIGTTPLVDLVERADTPRVYTVRKNGYENATASLSSARDGTAKLVLKKRGHSPPQPPSTVGDRGVNPFGP